MTLPKIFILTAFLGIMSISLSAFSQISTNVYTDTKNGFSIEKPSSWSFIGEVMSAREELNDGKDTRSVVMKIRVAFRETLKYHSRTLCTIIDVKDESTDPLAVLTKKIEKKSKIDKGFKVLQDPKIVAINNIQTAHASFSYLDDTSNGSVTRGSSNWYFMAGSQMFRLECSTHSLSFDEADVEFNKIAQTLKLTQ